MPPKPKRPRQEAAGEVLPQQPPQQRQQRDPVPPGWRNCPNIGTVSPMHKLIPMKVPLGNQPVAEMTGGSFTPQRAADEAFLAIQQAQAASKVQKQETIVLVIDLTNSTRYYNPQDFWNLGIGHVKVPCRGRGESPSPQAVNQVAWEVHKSLINNPDGYILIHCTHGYNRTGYMIVSVLNRLFGDTGMCVERALRRFKEQRPPGIYKNDYIDDMFRAHNEARPKVVLTPSLPDWKPEDDPEEYEGRGEQDATAAAEGGTLEPLEMEHDDRVGEAIPEEEADYLRKYVHDAIACQDEVMKGAYQSNSLPHMRLGQRDQGRLFAGSQPVSLDRKNLEAVMDRRYFVTWKADGTRYMMLLTKWGSYLMDRSCNVRRVTMRFPTLLPPVKEGGYPVGPPHIWTLLDGEMVVDTLAEGKQRRRYLAYDIMVINREGVMDLPFQDRYKLIEKEVERPRALERSFLQSKPNPQFLYQYEQEPFGMRRKDFWPLHKASKVLKDFIPALTHESDGLILQPWEDGYFKGTCHSLLKWKYAHMNSVDFMLDCKFPRDKAKLCLNYGNKRGHEAVPGAHLDPSSLQQPELLHGKVVECARNEDGTWRFMRVRPDKPTANFITTYQKVQESIRDNVQEEELVEKFKEAYEKSGLYQEEHHWLQAGASGVAPAAAAAASGRGRGGPPPGYHQQQGAPSGYNQQQQQQQGLGHAGHGYGGPRGGQGSGDGIERNGHGSGADEQAGLGFEGHHGEEGHEGEEAEGAGAMEEDVPAGYVDLEDGGEEVIEEEFSGGAVDQHSGDEDYNVTESSPVT